MFGDADDLTMEPLLKVTDLHVALAGGTPLVCGVNFSLARGETFVLLGESGSGKSITALSIMRLLPPMVRIREGRIVLSGSDLLTLPEFAMRDIRGRCVAMIFQEPQTSLNPVLTIGRQISEVVARHQGGRRAVIERRVIELLDAVGIPDPVRRVQEFPHQFSGGMKQRVMIAAALAGSPDLLIADEPTTALDVTIQAQVLELLKSLQRDTGMAILFITHDLAVASEMADHVAVMRSGELIEQRDRAFFNAPQHAYSQALFDALPDKAKRTYRASTTEEPILAVHDLKVHYPIKKGVLKRTVDHARAVDGVSLRLRRGRTLAVVGESGSGKTTLGKGIVQLLPITSGRVVFDNKVLNQLGGRSLRAVRSDLQIVFQDPYSSLNPRMMVASIIAEGMIAQGLYSNQRACLGRIGELLEQVGLEASHAHRYPHEFSGGQRQRLCIARALAVAPQVIVCDEPTSSLDISVQAQILALLKDLQERLSLSYLFITHNIGVVAYLADDVAVMYQGKFVEQGSVEEVLEHPKDPYTKRLLAAVPTIRKTGAYKNR